MKADRLLTEMFLGEANIEVPDEEMASLKRVVTSAARIRRLPANAPSWIVDKSPKARRASDVSAAPARAHASTPPPASSPVAPDSRTGRVIPATNRFRQQEPEDEPQDEPAAAPSAPAPKAKPSGPGLIKRAFSALRGRDPENGLPVPKPAASKVHGKAGKASLPDLNRFFNSSPSVQGSHAASTGGASDDPLAAYPNKAPEAPAGIDVDSDDDRVLSKGWGAGDDDDDPVMKNVTKSLAKFKKKEKAPQSNDDFEGDEKTDVDVKPAPKAKAQHPSKSGGKERKKESLTLLRQMVVGRNDRRY